MLHECHFETWMKESVNRNINWSFGNKKFNKSNKSSAGGITNRLGQVEERILEIKEDGRNYLIQNAIMEKEEIENGHPHTGGITRKDPPNIILCAKSMSEKEYWKLQERKKCYYLQSQTC